ncbi:restriction endonuclease subunit S [Psychrobacter celer]|uniref:restriction endonuclease subunit S n=1 Tax=Psychrobacter celer TaxID=306572 RepID=UPI003FD54315
MIKNEASKVPENWQECVLSDILYFQNGHAFKSHDFIKNNADEELIPLVKQSQLKGSQVILDDCVFLPSEYLDKYSDFIIRKGDILIGMSGSIGKMSFYNYDYPSLLNQRVGKLELYSKDIFNNNFFGYLLLNLEQNIQTIAKGIGVQNVSSKDIEKIIINLPPINEQNRIVDKIETLFSEVDAGIANLTLAKRQLEQYRQSLLKHAFEGKLTAKWREKHGKALPSADELLEQIQIARQDYYDQQMADWEQAVKSWEDQGKEGVKPRKPSKLDSVTDIDNMENLPTLPDGWRFHRLADIAEVGSGMSVSKNRKVDNPIEVNYLRVANVQRGYLDLDEIKTMIIDKFTFGRYELLEGDILFNEGGDRDKLGRGWIWKNEVDNCITQNHVFRASTHIKNIAHSEFISHWGNTFGRDYFERTGKQTTNLASINKTVLSSFPVPYPSIEEQSLIVKLLNEKTSEVDNLVAELELQLKKATLLKNSILHKAFQGKLVPQDPNDPPASELLAQIKAEREAKALAEKQVKQDKAASKSKMKTKSAKTPKKPKKDEQITLPL